MLIVVNVQMYIAVLLITMLLLLYFLSIIRTFKYCDVYNIMLLSNLLINGNS